MWCRFGLQIHGICTTFLFVSKKSGIFEVSLFLFYESKLLEIRIRFGSVAIPIYCMDDRQNVEHGVTSHDTPEISNVG